MILLRGLLSFTGWVDCLVWLWNTCNGCCLVTILSCFSMVLELRPPVESRVNVWIVCTCIRKQCVLWLISDTGTKKTLLLGDLLWRPWELQTHRIKSHFHTRLLPRPPEELGNLATWNGEWGETKSSPNRNNYETRSNKWVELVPLKRDNWVTAAQAYHLSRWFQLLFFMGLTNYFWVQT